MGIFNWTRCQNMNVVCLVIFTFLMLDLGNVDAATNLALGKPADQTGGSGGDLVDGNAVDGRYGDSTGPDNCAYSGTIHSGYGAWWVDLGQEYYIDNVTVYNTGETYDSARMTEFVVSVEPTLDSRTDCNQPSTDVVPPLGNKTIQCVGIRGRFVHYRRTGGFEYNTVVLCEVEVYGREQIGAPTTTTTTTTQPTPVVTSQSPLGACTPCSDNSNNTTYLTLSAVLGTIVVALLIGNIIQFIQYKRKLTKAWESDKNGKDLRQADRRPDVSVSRQADRRPDVSVSGVEMGDIQYEEVDDVTSGAKVYHGLDSQEKRNVYENNAITGPYAEIHVK